MILTVHDLKIRSKEDVKQILDEAVGRITRHFNPERIILFGSLARGTADKHSDVDLLVVMPDEVDRRQTAIAIMEKLSGLGFAKDVIVATPDSIKDEGAVCGYALYYALREGVVLYER